MPLPLAIPPAAAARVTASLLWHGDDIMAKIKEEMNQRLNRAAAILALNMKRNLGTPGPAPSLPGGFPHRQSGGLQDSIVVIPNYTKTSVYVGVRRRVKDQALALEYGTSRMAARPFVRPTVEESKPAMKAEMAKAGGGGSGISVDSGV